MDPDEFWRIKYQQRDFIESMSEAFWELGRIYQRMLLKKDKNHELFIDNLITILTSFIIPKLDNYESSLYYENIDYLYKC